jgi:hypothetical protein
LGLGGKNCVSPAGLHIGLYGATVIREGMKMLKKCLFAITVVALLAATVQADTAQYKGHPWPWPIEWKEVVVCKFPVFMEIGYWIEIKDCQDLEIILVQVDCDKLKGKSTDKWPCYEGCEKIKVRTNFEANLDLDFEDDADLVDDDKVFWEDILPTVDDDIQVGPTGGDWQELTICLDLWSTDLWETAVPSRAGEKSKIGEIEIKVEPTADVDDLIIKPYQP